jgi:hypothetical protein
MKISVFHERGFSFMKPEFKSEKGNNAKLIKAVQFDLRAKRTWPDDEVYALYTVNTLLNFIEIIEQKQKPQNQEERCMRFLVSSRFELWFGFEGRPSRTNKIPPHSRITGVVGDKECITAGNIFYDSDGKTIVGISNKSGNFCPDYDSIKWALVIMFLCEVKFSDKIFIEKTADNGIITRHKNIDIVDLKNQVLDCFDEQQQTKLCGANTKLAPREVVFGVGRSAANSNFGNRNRVKRRLLFSGDSSNQIDDSSSNQTVGVKKSKKGNNKSGLKEVSSLSSSLFLSKNKKIKKGNQGDAQQELITTEKPAQVFAGGNFFGVLFPTQSTENQGVKKRKLKYSR